MIGYCLSAIDVALMMRGIMLALPFSAPRRALALFLANIISSQRTSSVKVSWGTFRDSVMLRAMSRWMPLSGTVCLLDMCVPTDWAFEICLLSESSWAVAVEDEWEVRICSPLSSSTFRSSFNILPPGPVPRKRKRSKPISLASFRTAGVVSGSCLASPFSLCVKLLLS